MMFSKNAAIDLRNETWPQKLHRHGIRSHAKKGVEKHVETAKPWSKNQGVEIPWHQGYAGSATCALFTFAWSPSEGQGRRGVVMKRLTKSIRLSPKAIISSIERLHHWDHWSKYHWIGSREHLPETPVFDEENHNAIGKPMGKPIDAPFNPMKRTLLAMIQAPNRAIIRHGHFYPQIPCGND